MYSNKHPKVWRKIAYSVALGLYALLSSLVLAAAPAPQVGDTFPDFRTHNVSGIIPDTVGKVVLIDFWASWCTPCRKELPELNTLHEDYADQDVVIIGVNVDEKIGAMNKFLKKYPVAFPILFDAEHSLISTVKAETMPTSFVVDRKGKIRFIHKGFHGQESVDLLRQQITQLLSEKE